MHKADAKKFIVVIDSIKKNYNKLRGKKIKLKYKKKMNSEIYFALLASVFIDKLLLFLPPPHQFSAADTSMSGKGLFPFFSPPPQIFECS